MREGLMSKYLRNKFLLLARFRNAVKSRIPGIEMDDPLVKRGAQVTLGLVLKDRRTFLGLSRQNLSDLTGVSVEVIKGIEEATEHDMTRETYEKLVDKLRNLGADF